MGVRAGPAAGAVPFGGAVQPLPNLNTGGMFNKHMPQIRANAVPQAPAKLHSDWIGGLAPRTGLGNRGHELTFRKR